MRFIPTLRHVEDDLKVENTSDQTELQLEYRDETNRPWWKFFDEYEYRQNKYDRASHKWFKWFDERDTASDKKLICKLDVLLTFYALVVYWVKYLDQTNVNNAYVSGMREDLGFEGNDLVQVQAMYIVGAVIFQLPFMYILPKVPLHIVLPVMDLCWGLMTLFCCKIHSVAALKVLRFFVGVFESGFVPTAYFLMGSWYKPSEFARRAGFFYMGQFLGLLSSGLLASAALDLHGLGGFEGWRWVFIIDAIATLPLAVIGYFMIPGTPDKCVSLFLSDDEIRRCRERMRPYVTEKKAKPSKKLTDWTLWKPLLTSWQLPTMILITSVFYNNNSGNSGSFLLWLKSLTDSDGNQRYTNQKINQLSSVAPGLGFVYVYSASVFADMFKCRWGAIVITQVFNFIGCVILAIWDVTESAKWFAFCLQYMSWSMSPVLFGWVSDIMRHDPQEYAIVVICMNMIGQSSSAWVSVLVFPTVESPRFTKGFGTCAACAACCAIGAMVILYFYKRDEKRICYKNGIVLEGQIMEVLDADKIESEATSQADKVLEKVSDAEMSDGKAMSAENKIEEITEDQVPQIEENSTIVIKKEEKAARALISKLNLQKVEGITRVVLKRTRQHIFVIANPEVYKTPTGNSYVVFGEAQHEDMQATARAAQIAAAQAQQAAAETGSVSEAAAAGEVGAELASKDPASITADLEAASLSKDEDAEDEAEADATGLEDSDIKLVMEQANVSRNKAINGLKKNDSDVVNTIMDLCK
ncbi:major facilitator superfamily domain-containing protein [Yarrowia lipolytica]|nr:major facilitator superfamily domain-containing protein [Yarrowia lipolytica]RDW38901.1 major facilitator superfamily domain-containing protein [Yarrowia lipolytica]RDW44804.1 major facilitator superfamily domain-containing protein [Yarrowia lipolytica]RDW51776.1 major facilitator superfamily domain-containing protein [Yarrowia lipolytica]RMI95066.1 major facilitator superfamily domain-containing protein [Yarrowia lipolytica]